MQIIFYPKRLSSLRCGAQGRALFLLVLLCCARDLASKPSYHSEWGYTLNPPVGWTLIDDADRASMAFTDPTRRAVFQILSFPGSRFSSADEMFRQVKEELGAEGKQAPFVFARCDSVLADLTFSSGRIDVRGYLIFINGESSDHVLMASSTLDAYQSMHDLLLSCLDSFSPDGETELLPGPVSQFYYPFPGKNLTPHRIDIAGAIHQVGFDEEELEASQVVIEREARILASYPKEQTGAWKRFYEVIYRDNYHRLDGVAALVEKAVSLEEGAAVGTGLSRTMLAWIQSFAYARTGTLSDLLSPVSAAFSASGDCDSRALLYIILLHHLDIDSILLVSSRFGHSLAGVNVPGQGARIDFEGKSYLVAETTQEVDLGLIRQDMADANGWIPIRLGR